MSRLLFFVLGTLCGAALMTFASQSDMDPVRLSPQNYKVRLDNDRVRVMEYHLKPGEKEPMHTHPVGFVYVLSNGSMRSTMPDGRSSVVEGTAGEVFWREQAMTHATENVGK